jgi:serine/threonine protein kinase
MDSVMISGSQPADLRPGDEVGEYVIAQKIGEGGMAAVYGAVHPIIGKKAAIKVMSTTLASQPEQVDRFVQEARAVNAIGHPNIVDVFGFGALADGRAYFVMEWLQGTSLEDFLIIKRPPLEVTLDVLDQIAEALQAAHEKGIIHRDLKPANVFLVPGPRERYTVKLLDFGVAKLTAPLDGMPKARGQTANGQVVGTPEYISPEQARGQEVDGASDVYSLGVVAYQMVLGKLPFEGECMLDVLRSQVSDAPPPPRQLWAEIPPPLEQLLLALLAKAPEERPTLPGLRTALAELPRSPLPLDTGGPGTLERLPTTPRVEAVPPPRSAQRAWLIALVVAIGVAALALTRVMHRPTPATVGVSHTTVEALVAAPPPPAELTTSPPVELTRPPSTERARPAKKRTLARDTDYLVNPFSEKR